MIEFELKLPNGTRVLGVVLPPPAKTKGLPRPTFEVPAETVPDEQERKSA